jgi:hypothetical protein
MSQPVMKVSDLIYLGARQQPMQSYPAGRRSCQHAGCAGQKPPQARTNRRGVFNLPVNSAR